MMLNRNGALFKQEATRKINLIKSQLGVYPLFYDKWGFFLLNNSLFCQLLNLIK